MTSIASKTPTIVITPELLGAGLFDPDAYRFIQDWGSGNARLGMSKTLAIAYLRILRKLGVPEHLLRRWNLWFHWEERTVWIDTEAPNPDIESILTHVALATQASAIIYWKKLAEPAPTPTPWISLATWENQNASPS